MNYKLKKMSDWTKGGRWNRVTVYRYGSGRQYYHLCFYNDESIDWSRVGDTDWEFEITQVIDNPDMVCMLYPFVDKAALLDQLNAWLKNSEECAEAIFASSISYPYGVKVHFHRQG